MNISDFTIVVADASHVKLASAICEEMLVSAASRGTGIAKRTPEYVAQKMNEGKAVIALDKNGEWAGFTYIESWAGKRYVANSGLIINPEYRKIGLAKSIKRKAFALSLKLFPESTLFGLTSGLAVMKINNYLGYKPVPFSELTDDEKFWQGCASCVNYHILLEKDKKFCICTAMLFDPKVDELRFDIDEVLAKNDFTLAELTSKGRAGRL